MYWLPWSSQQSQAFSLEPPLQCLTRFHQKCEPFCHLENDTMPLYPIRFEYPEIEALVVLQRRRFRFQEVPCKMYSRVAGRSSITALKSFYYIAHVLLGVFMNVLKYDRRRRQPVREDKWTAS